MERWQRWMTTTGPSYSFGGRTNQDSGSRVWGGRLRFGRWGLGQWLYIPKTCCVFFRNCLACVRRCFCVYVYRLSVSSLVLSFLFSGFYYYTASTMRRVSSYSCSRGRLNAQESRRVLYPSCIVASRYWRVLVLTGCLFLKSENRRAL